MLPCPACQFVILRHEMPPESDRGLHWDLMLEQAGVLRTWALSEEPRIGSTIQGLLLDDHRLAYLEFEGEVTGGRGIVTAWMKGTYKLYGEDTTQFVIDLLTPNWTSRVVAAQREKTDEWQFQFDPIPSLSRGFE
ncbi:MAG: hypothetical protein CMJ81_18935 [Planctomycetaceae bacterium]|nr:hypothetical protein [Planctomycetaceae bacterium]MBP61424.1 hypothetical protein [Planctomycetaceae bacterium]